MKTKHCPLCNLDLPKDAFTSTRAKYCKNCKRIRQLEQQKEMQQRAFERAKAKKQKKEQVMSLADLKRVSKECLINTLEIGRAHV